MVAVAELNGKTLWYDPTISQQGGDYDNRWFPDYQYGLVIRDGETALSAIPYTSDYRMDIEDHYETSAYDSTWIAYKVTTDYWGGKADDMRSWFLDRSSKEIEKLYLKYYTNNFKEITLDKPITHKDNITENHFQTTEYYRIKNFWQKVDTTTKSKLKAFIYPQPIRDEQKQYAATRKMPLTLSFPTDLHQRIVLKMPDSWDITPEIVTFNDAGIEYKSNVWDADTILYFDYHYKVTADHCPAEKAETHRDITDKIIKDLGYNLTYNPNKTTTIAGYKVNYPLLLLGFLILGITIYFAFRYFLSVQRTFDYNEALPLEIGGWLAFVAIGITFTPFIRIYELIDGDYINLGSWEGITNAEYTSYNPRLAMLFVIEYIFHIVILIYSLLTVIIFYQKRKEAPDLIKILYITFALAPLLITSGLVWADAGEFDGDAIQTIFRNIVSACIWIPYFSISSRVKETFIK